jgi:hypothetical protein
VAYKQRGEAGRVRRIEIGDPIIQLEDHQMRAKPGQAAHYRRQDVSPVALAGAAAVVAWVGIGVVGSILCAAAWVNAASIANIDGTLLNTVARTSVGGTTVNGVLVVEASACRVELNKLITHGGECMCWIPEEKWCWSDNWWKDESRFVTRGEKRRRRRRRRKEEE